MTENQNPAGGPRLRASHEDRDSVIEALRVHAGDGRLTVEELEARIEAAATAVWVDELAPLTADLPVLGRRVPGAGPQPRGEVPEVARIQQVHGGRIVRGGAWIVPRRLELSLTWTGLVLDFTEAVIGADHLDVDLAMVGQNLVIVTRPDMRVDLDDLTLEFVSVAVKRGADAPRAAALPSGIDARGATGLTVKVRGNKMHGRIVVRPARRTFWQWLTRAEPVLALPR